MPCSSASFYSNSVDQAIYCAQDCSNNTICQGICPNPDLSGVGVRVGFYLQALMNTLLVLLSPEDSAQGAWAGTVLTAALVIPALFQKFKGSLTLHHATLVLNFSTLSCVASFAVAPMCNVWRPKKTPSTAPGPSVPSSVVREGNELGLSVDDARDDDDDCEVHEIKQSQAHPYLHPVARGSEQDISHVPSENDDHPQADPTPPETVSESPTTTETQGTTGRIILSIALLIQAILQWTWAIVLFTSPKYSQPACAANTTLVLFGYPVPLSDIRNATDNSSKEAHVGFVIWPLWLLFSVSVTMIYGIIFVVSSASSAHEEGRMSRKETMSAASSTSSLHLIPRRRRSRHRHEQLPRPATPTSLSKHISAIFGRIWLKIWLAARFVGLVFICLLPPRRNPKPQRNKDLTARRLIWLGNIGAFCISVLYLVVSEVQIYENCILSGETTMWSFGQTAAILLAFAPAWALVVATHRFPGRVRQKRKEKKRRKKEEKRRRQEEDARLAARGSRSANGSPYLSPSGMSSGFPMHPIDPPGMSHRPGARPGHNRETSTTPLLNVSSSESPFPSHSTSRTPSSGQNASQPPPSEHSLDCDDPELPVSPPWETVAPRHASSRHDQIHTLNTDISTNGDTGYHSPPIVLSSFVRTAARRRTHSSDRLGDLDAAHLMEMLRFAEESPQ